VKNEVVVVTGASADLGRAIARHFGSKGAGLRLEVLSSSCGYSFLADCTLRKGGSILGKAWAKRETARRMAHQDSNWWGWLSHWRRIRAHSGQGSVPMEPRCQSTIIF
jgi:hypothetical protein